MKLSIGMIVKNEEKYLEQCLQALMPILDGVESELIIADTGSTDKTMEIARKFTSSVFNYDWHDDFAAARNATLQRARGEWFMFIDADEIIVNAEPLIRFFNSNEYKAYNLATYIVRSYTTVNKEMYSDFEACRLTKIMPDTKFIKPVHEMIVPVTGAKKSLDVVADHYGYIDDDKIAKHKKAKGYIDILKNELEKTPDSAVICLQLCEAYKATEEYDEAIFYAEKGISLIKKPNSLSYALFITLASIYNNIDDFEQVVKVSERYFVLKNHKIAIDIEMYAYLVFAYFNLKQYQQVLIAYQNYTYLRDLLVNGFLNTEDKGYHSIQYVSHIAYRYISYMATDVYIELKEYDKAKDILKSIPVSEDIDTEIDLQERVKRELKLMDITSDFSGLVDLYQEINVVTVLQNEINQFCNTHSENKENLLNTLCNSNLKGQAYIKLLQIRLDDLAGDRDILKQLNDFPVDEIKNFDIYYDLIYFALKYKLSLGKISEMIDLAEFMDYLYKLSNNYKDFYSYLNDYIQLDFTINTVKELSCACLLHEFILNQLNYISNIQTQEIFDNYVVLTKSLLPLLYQENLLTDEFVQVLPKNMRFGYFCIRATESKADGQLSKYVGYLKVALKEMPQMKDIIIFLQQEIEQQINKEKQVVSEIEIQSRQIKEMILKFLTAKQIGNAKQTLEAYEQINPSDSDIVHLKNQIKLLENNM